MSVKIEGREVTKDDFLSPVTYVPVHAKGSAGHKDCDKGVVIRANDYHVFVLYCKTRTVQTTAPEMLVWG